MRLIIDVPALMSLALDQHTFGTRKRRVVKSANDGYSPSGRVEALD
jgi:hypothetical protein